MPYGTHQLDACTWLSFVFLAYVMCVIFRALPVSTWVEWPSCPTLLEFSMGAECLRNQPETPLPWKQWNSWRNWAKETGKSGFYYVRHFSFCLTQLYFFLFLLTCSFFPSFCSLSSQLMVTSLCKRMCCFYRL